MRVPNMEYIKTFFATQFIFGLVNTRFAKTLFASVVSKSPLINLSLKFLLHS